MTDYKYSCYMYIVLSKYIFKILYNACVHCKNVVSMVIQ